MNRYRIVYSTEDGAGASVKFVAGASAQEAIQALKAGLDHEAWIISIKLETRDPAPAQIGASADITRDSLVRALVKTNSILTALAANPMFMGSLSRERQQSLAAVLAEAQAALDLAGVKRGPVPG